MSAKRGRENTAKNICTIIRLFNRFNYFFLHGVGLEGNLNSARNIHFPNIEFNLNKASGIIL